MRQAGKSGGSEPLGAGESQERRRRTRKAWIIGSAFAIGLVAGLLVGFQEGEDLFLHSDGWPPALAVGIALSYLVVVIIGGIALGRQTDEVELQRQYKAVAVAALVYVLAYPIWFSLWMGGLVPEPMHAVLFIAFWASLAAAFLFYRFR
jgi:hypothetical protein